MDLGGGIGRVTTVKMQTDPVPVWPPQYRQGKGLGFGRGLRPGFPSRPPPTVTTVPLNLSSSVRYKKVCIVRIVMKTLWL